MAERVGFRKTYRPEFCLDETRLRKIADILREFGHRLSPNSVVRFHIHRRNNSFQETENVERLFEDDNTPGKEISSVLVDLRTPGPDSLESHASHDDREAEEATLAAVVFDADDVNRIVVATRHEDRDWCVLLFDALDGQVQQTLKRALLGLRPGRFIDLGAMFLLFGIVTSLVAMNLMIPSPQWALPAHATSDVKLDRILSILTEGEAVRLPLVRLLVPAMFLGTLILIAATEWRPLSRLVRMINHSVFFWGGMKEREERLTKIISNVAWGVVVGLVVAVVAGWIVVKVFGH